MTTDQRRKMLDLFFFLRSSSEATLRAFAWEDIMQQHAQSGISYGPLSRLRAYARCRAFALQFRREGQTKMARREAGRAGAEAKYFLAL